MSTIINKTEEILNQLQEEDKVKIMDSPEELAKILAIDELMEKINRDYQIKESNSQISSAYVILKSY